MNEKKRLNKFIENVWIIIVVLSIIFITTTLFIMSHADDILVTAFKLAGSSQKTEDIEDKALAFLNMAMLKPQWEGLWMGIFGIFIAFGLKKEGIPEVQKFAWILGVLWGIMMITNGTIQGGYEVLILGWNFVCFETFIYFIIGVPTLISLLIVRKDYFS